METTLKSFLNEIRIGEAKENGFVKIYPLFCDEDEIECVSLDDSIKRRYAVIKEIDAVGSVPEITFVNKSDMKIFIWEGEEFIGAKQNRSPNVSILIDKKTAANIPVTCIEQGRWEYKSQKFKTSKSTMPNNLRRFKNASVTVGLNHSERYLSDQYEVWKEIENYMKEAKAESKTMDLNEIVEKDEKKWNERIKDFPVEKGQKGFIVFIDDYIVGAEYLSNAKTFKKLYSKMLSSYLAEAKTLEKKIKKNDIRFTIKPEDFIKELYNYKTKPFDSPSIGKDLRFGNKTTGGYALVDDDKLIYFHAWRGNDKIKKYLDEF